MVEKNISEKKWTERDRERNEQKVFRDCNLLVETTKGWRVERKK